MPGETRPMQAPEPPDPAALAAWQAELAAARRSPWLASLFMRRLGTVRARLAELRDWLASLPRRLRRGWTRGWTRRWALTLPAAALVMALASWSALAKMDAAITVDPGGSGCTLAAAITNANNDNQSGSASCAGGSGADTIGFANENGIYSYTSALPTITSAITIQGNGNTTIRRTGGPEFSVLRVTNGNGENPGSLALANATISGGSASRGGGIFSQGSTVSLTSTSISGNSTGGAGGGIHVDTEGVVPGRVEIQNSIVAEQTAGADCAGMGEMVSGGDNIESVTSCGFKGTGDQQSVSAAVLKLGDLGLNAPGTTRTRALGAGSAALDQIQGGTNGCGTTTTDDQRGIARPQEAGCDVGAFDLQPGAVVRAGQAFLPVAWGQRQVP